MDRGTDGSTVLPGIPMAERPSTRGTGGGFGTGLLETDEPVTNESRVATTA
jgi:hypothetical protein